MRKTTEDIVRWLKQHDRLAIITHLHPDGDALGSSLALCLALRTLGRQAFVCCQDRAPDFLQLLPCEGALFVPEEIPFEPAAVLCVDCAAASRFGRAAQLIRSYLPLACIDHHETNDLTCDAGLIDANAAAAGELAAAVIEQLGVSLTSEMALCLYVAISTDTGNFSFSCTTPQCLRVLASCLETGLDLDGMNYELFRKRSVARTRLLGRALSGIRYLNRGTIALIELKRQDFEDCGATNADTESIVNYGINTAGVDVAIMAVEQADSTVKFSLRSRGKVNVAQIARPLGGGGHDRAAGITLPLPFDQAVGQVLETVQAALNG